MNSFNQYTKYSCGNGLITTKTFDGLGMLSGIVTDTIQNLGYVFNAETGNLTSRRDNRRNPDTWTYTNIPATTFSRGYTGHEHIDQFSLINMNGRMYDPVLGRFLSPDPFIANSFFTQDFNRYSYVINNPLKYIDPSGYTKRMDDPPLGGPDNNDGIHILESGVPGSGGGSGDAFNSFVNAKIDGSWDGYFNSYYPLYDIMKLDPNFNGVFTVEIIDYYTCGIEGGKIVYANYNYTKIILSLDGAEGGGGKLADDVSTGTGLWTSMVSEAARGINNPVVKSVSKGAGVIGGLVGTVDNTNQAAKAFSRGDYVEGSLQTTQAAGYVTGTVMLFTPLAPIGAGILLVNTVIDIGEYFYKNW